MASTGNRATHRLSGRPQMPGVVNPWPSMRKPTARQPRASRTRLPSRLRPAAADAATATARAQAEMALTTTRWDGRRLKQQVQTRLGPEQQQRGLRRQQGQQHDRDPPPGRTGLAANLAHINRIGVRPQPLDSRLRSGRSACRAGLACPAPRSPSRAGRHMGSPWRAARAIDRSLRAFEAGRLPESTCADRLTELEQEVRALEVRTAALEAKCEKCETTPAVEQILVESRACIQPYFVAPTVRTRIAPRRRTDTCTNHGIPSASLWVTTRGWGRVSWDA
jgi:hypothetical protein